MDMRYDGTLLLPQKCVVMNEDEMMYVEGGIGIPNWLFAGAVNTVISAAVGGALGLGTRYFRTMAIKYGERRAAVLFSSALKKQLLIKGIAAGTASAACGLAQAVFTVLTWATDPGNALANYIDARDKIKNNKYVDIL